MTARPAIVLLRPALLAIAFAIALAPFSARASEANPAAVLGNWVDSEDNVAIDLYSCESGLCATVTTMVRIPMMP